MSDKIKAIENTPFYDDDFDAYVDWYGKLQQYFAPKNVDDISDFDRTISYNYLISLNHNNEGLSSKALDLLLISRDAYFMEVEFSREKPLIIMHFWQYPKGSKGHVLNTSQEPFLKEHRGIKQKFITFARENKLMILDKHNLRAKVLHDGALVTVYYKYFCPLEEYLSDVSF